MAPYIVVDKQEYYRYCQFMPIKFTLINTCIQYVYNMPILHIKFLCVKYQAGVCLKKKIKFKLPAPSILQAAPSVDVRKRISAIRLDTYSEI